MIPSGHFHGQDGSVKGGQEFFVQSVPLSPQLNFACALVNLGFCLGQLARVRTCSSTDLRSLGLSSPRPSLKPEPDYRLSVQIGRLPAPPGLAPTGPEQWLKAPLPATVISVKACRIVKVFVVIGRLLHFNILLRPSDL